MKHPKPGWASIVTAEYIIEHFSALGPFRPKRARTFVPYAERVAYAGNGRHHASRSRRPGAWLVSILRDLGEALIGPFSRPDVSQVL